MTRTSVSLLALTAPLTLGATAVCSQEAGTPWDLLAAIEIEEIVTDTTYEVRKVFPSTVENGIEQFDITGYIVPLSEGPEISEFILVSDMGFCPFCGSPEHGTSLQVSMAEPLVGVGEGSRITLRGELEAVTDPETWQTTILTGARAL